MHEFTYPTLKDTAPYLRRIGWQGELRRDKATLDALIHAHQCAIPFENLSVLQGKPVPAELPALWEKVVLHRRGGYCFELNLLFLALLRTLGFDAYACMARVAGDWDYLRPVLHRGSIVRLDGQRYYCDVGFGGAMAPFAVALSPQRQSAYGEIYRVEEAEEGWLALRRQFAQPGSEERTIAFFAPQPFLSEDFQTFHYYCSRHPDSSFRRQPFLYRRCEGGYVSLTGETFTHFQNGEKTTQTISAEELPGVLREHFYLEL